MNKKIESLPNICLQGLRRLGSWHEGRVTSLCLLIGLCDATHLSWVSKSEVRDKYYFQVVLFRHRLLHFAQEHPYVKYMKKQLQLHNNRNNYIQTQHNNDDM